MYWFHAAFGSASANKQRQQLSQLGIHRAPYALCLLLLWHLDRRVCLHGFIGRECLSLNELCRAEVKAEGDADTHSRSGTHQRRKQRSLTPELRLTRSMQPPQGSQPYPQPTDQRKNGRSLPVKLEQPAASGEKPALNQGSSGSPGKGTGSSIQQGGIQKRNSKPVVADGDGTVKAEVTSNRLRQGTGGASTSGESHSHVDLAAACPDQADAVGGSGGLVCTACFSFGVFFSFLGYRGVVHPCH